MTTSCESFILRASVCAIVVLCGATVTHAKFTTDKCIAAKLKAWGKFRQCQRNEEAKSVQGKTADVTKCSLKLQMEQLPKINGKATKAGVACRYLDNGDLTITDTDTGLMWEKKIPFTVNQSYAWAVPMTDYLSVYNGMSADGGVTLRPPFSHRDWRLPNVLELTAIVDTNVLGCGSGTPCIDPIFGPTGAGNYWSSTVNETNQATAFAVSFFIGSSPVGDFKTTEYLVRVVRNAL